MLSGKQTNAETAAGKIAVGKSAILILSFCKGNHGVVAFFESLIHDYLFHTRREFYHPKSSSVRR